MKKAEKVGGKQRELYNSLRAVGKLSEAHYFNFKLVHYLREEAKLFG